MSNIHLTCNIRHVQNLTAQLKIAEQELDVAKEKILRLTEELSTARLGRQRKALLKELELFVYQTSIERNLPITEAEQWRKLQLRKPYPILLDRCSSNI